MPIPGGSIAVTGTPVTTQLGTGGVSGNALTIGGLSIAPLMAGWGLQSWQGGPGFVSGMWGYSSGSGRPGGGGGVGRAGSGARTYYGGGGGGGGDLGADYLSDEIAPMSTGLSKTGWLLLGLIALTLLKDK